MPIVVQMMILRQTESTQQKNFFNYGSKWKNLILMLILFHWMSKEEENGLVDLQEVMGTVLLPKPR